MEPKPKGGCHIHWSAHYDDNTEKSLDFMKYPILSDGK
jgi:hypothetical protein